MIWVCLYSHLVKWLHVLSLRTASMFNAKFNALRELVPRLIGIPLALFAADQYLRNRAYRLKTAPIDNIMKVGTKPPLPCRVSKLCIDRSEVVDSIRDKFISSPDMGDFGVVLGPTGTGKTMWHVRHVIPSQQVYCIAR